MTSAFSFGATGSDLNATQKMITFSKTYFYSSSVSIESTKKTTCLFPFFPYVFTGFDMTRKLIGENGILDNISYKYLHKSHQWYLYIKTGVLCAQFSKINY